MALDQPGGSDNEEPSQPKGARRGERLTMRRRTFLAASLVPVASLVRGAAPPASQDDWQGVQRVIAVGDIHGDKDALVAVLKMAGIIDDEEHWIAGTAHLVQIGDVPGRGPQTREAFDLMMRLEKEAVTA